MAGRILSLSWLSKDGGSHCLYYFSGNRRFTCLRFTEQQPVCGNVTDQQMEEKTKDTNSKHYVPYYKCLDHSCPCLLRKLGSFGFRKRNYGPCSFLRQ